MSLLLKVRFVSNAKNTDLQDEVRSLTNNLKSSQALEQQVSDREAILEDKIAKVIRAYTVCVCVACFFANETGWVYNLHIYLCTSLGQHKR